MAKGNESRETSGRRKKRSISYFLLSLLEDESYPHVQWTNKEKGEFQIHWMHASSGAWTRDNDAETFRLWAKAKGKLNGRENHYKTWKANFRCAMKSRNELQEIKLPKSSPYKKKNLKFWRFTDMELVKSYKDGEAFDWNRTRTQSSSRKPTRVLRRRRKRTLVDTDETSESEENESSPPSFDHCEPQSSSMQSVPSDSRLQTNYETKPFSEHEQMSLNMENDDNFNPYSVGLLHILDQENEETDSVVPNVSLGSYSQDQLPPFQESQIESHSFQEYSQLPPIQSFITEQPFPGTTLLEEDWEFFAEDEKEIKGKGTTRLFDIAGNEEGLDDDPFFYEGIYTELSRLGS